MEMLDISLSKAILLYQIEQNMCYTDTRKVSLPMSCLRDGFLQFA